MLNRWVIGILLFLPALIFLTMPIFEGREGAKFWSKELKNSGFIAVSFLFITLSLSPLTKMFPQVSVFKALKRYKRSIGLAVFFYACFHLLAFLLKAYFKKGYVPLGLFVRPVAMPGIIAFLLLIPLALTSNRFSLQGLGWEKWKKLHRLLYCSEALIFLHMAIQGGKIFLWACLFFAPLFFLQLSRMNSDI